MSAVRRYYSEPGIDTPVSFTQEPTYIQLKGYTAEVSKPIESEDDPLEHERLEVVVTHQQTQRDYYADFVTLHYLAGMLESSKETGEFAGGLYFPGQHRVVLQDLSFSTVKKALEDIIEDKELPFLFKVIE